MTLLFPDSAIARMPAAPKFQTVVADPAWQPRDALPGPGRGASKHYSTMSTPDIRSLAYRLPPIADDALLFLWRLSSMPFDGLDVCRAWGFEPVSEIVWVKVPKASPDILIEKAVRVVERDEPVVDTADVSMIRAGEMMRLAGARVFESARAVRMLLGHYVRLSHEVCIIAARKGAASRILAHDVPSVFFAPLGRHSEKPAAFYDIVERLAPGPYLELFARTPRNDQWTCMGDELGSRLDLPLAPSGDPTK